MIIDLNFRNLESSKYLGFQTEINNIWTMEEIPMYAVHAHDTTQSGYGVIYKVNGINVVLIIKRTSLRLSTHYLCNQKNVYHNIFK